MPTQMVEDSGRAQPQIVKCPVPVPQEMVQEIVQEDDHEEETLQTDAETAEKVTTSRTQIQDTDAPLHEVRDEFLDVSDDKVSDDDGCVSRSMTIKANNMIAADLLDYQHVMLHVRLTPETKESVNEVCL